MRYQKRLLPLDKQVDIYCAWIDEATELNRGGSKNKVGLVNRDTMREMKPAGSAAVK